MSSVHLFFWLLPLAPLSEPASTLPLIRCHVTLPSPSSRPPLTLPSPSLHPPCIASVITHNTNLINLVCNEIWIIEAGDPRPGGEGGNVRKWMGEFEEYRDMLAEELSLVIDEDPEVRPRARSGPG